MYLGWGWSKNLCGGVVVCFKACKIIWMWGICICILGLSFETFDWFVAEWGNFEIS